MSDDFSDFVVVLEARSTSEAILVRELLQAAGISAWVPGEFLTDDIAAPQKLMNVACAVVKVPADRFDDARQVIAEARSAGAEWKDAEYPLENGSEDSG